MTSCKHGLRPTSPNRYYHFGKGGEYRHANRQLRRYLKRYAARLERHQARAELHQQLSQTGAMAAWRRPAPAAMKG
mgnify:CR=1 FL=1|jgi:hypothetical protein